MAVVGGVVLFYIKLPARTGGHVVWLGPCPTQQWPIPSLAEKLLEEIDVSYYDDALLPRCLPRLGASENYKPPLQALYYIS